MFKSMLSAPHAVQDDITLLTPEELAAYQADAHQTALIGTEIAALELLSVALHSGADRNALIAVADADGSLTDLIQADPVTLALEELQEAVDEKKDEAKKSFWERHKKAILVSAAAGATILAGAAAMWAHNKGKVALAMPAPHPAADAPTQAEIIKKGQEVLKTSDPITKDQALAAIRNGAKGDSALEKFFKRTQAKEQAHASTSGKPLALTHDPKANANQVGVGKAPAEKVDPKLLALYHKLVGAEAKLSVVNNFSGESADKLARMATNTKSGGPLAQRIKGREDDNLSSNSAIKESIGNMIESMRTLERRTRITPRELEKMDANRGDSSKDVQEWLKDRTKVQDIRKSAIDECSSAIKEFFSHYADTSVTRGFFN